MGRRKIASNIMITVHTSEITNLRIRLKGLVQRFNSHTKTGWGPGFIGFLKGYQSGYKINEPNPHDAYVLCGYVTYDTYNGSYYTKCGQLSITDHNSIYIECAQESLSVIQVIATILNRIDSNLNIEIKVN